MKVHEGESVHLLRSSFAKGLKPSSRCVILPAGFKTFEFLDKEVLQNLGTLVEGRVAGVVVAAVVEDFGHVCYELRELDVLAPL